MKSITPSSVLILLWALAVPPCGARGNTSLAPEAGMAAAASAQAADPKAADEALARAAAIPTHAIPLESLDLSKVSSLAPPLGYPAKAGLSVAGKPLTIGGEVFARGAGFHSGSRMLIRLDGAAEKFIALVGVDDAQLPLPAALPGSQIPQGLRKHPGTAEFEIWLDGRKAYSSGPLMRGRKASLAAVDLRGASRMLLLVNDGGRWPYNNPADMAGAMFLLKAGAAARPQAVAVPPEPMPVIARGDGPQPAIHGPRVTGASPGRPFLFRIPATGQGPLRFNARNLPAGLRLDPKTGIITGMLQEEGETEVQLEVSGPRGRHQRALRIVSAPNRLALTPPLGWNSWNVWARAVDDKKIREAADWMVRSGLAAHGYQYIAIDDAWMGTRAADGEIRPNERFPDMKALTAYVHSLGLKIGIYSSPGPKTCQQLEGSYGHEEQDAMTYARWGFDLLKYDLCSYRQLIRDPRSREEMMKPYRIMGEALAKAPRDIVYSLCQYGLNNVWEWGPLVGGHLWRTTGDIRDSWESMSRIGFSQDGLEQWARPGGWNDPDMMVLGKVGWGVELHEARLNRNEQMTHLAIWSLLAAPILLGCDLSQMDPFTLAILTNDEVLEVNQDPLGKQGSRKSKQGLLEVWAKPMQDGTVAAGLFNLGVEEAPVTVRWSDIGLSGRQPVRDLWRRQDAGIYDGAYTVKVAPHGVAMVRIGKIAER